MQTALRSAYIQQRGRIIMEHTEKKIRRGDIYYVNFGYNIGSVQNFCRPGVVIQNNSGNAVAPTVIVAAITSEIKKTNLPVHAYIGKKFGLTEPSMVLLEQVKTVDKQNLGIYIGHVSPECMRRIDRAAAYSIGLRHLRVKAKERKPEMELCLCPICAQQFITSPIHVIRRADPLQVEKDDCDYCNVRKGFDFNIYLRHKKLGDDRY